MKINIEGLVQLLDNHEPRWRGHVTSVIGLVGEDINTAIFVDYLKRQRGIKDIVVLPDPVTSGQLQGQRLDRWIRVGNYLYQAEVKNWCSFRIGSYKLPLDATQQEVKSLANRHWVREKEEHYTGRDGRTNNPRHRAKGFGMVSKVLAEMKVPINLSRYSEKTRPLVIHWMPISIKNTNPFFFVPIKSLGLNEHLRARTQFDRVYYFSSSLYLRELVKSGKKKLDLDLPNVKTRLDALRTFLNL